MGLNIISHHQLKQFATEGWSIQSREEQTTSEEIANSYGLANRTITKITLEKKSWLVEDVGRSLGYIVGAPVVLPLSLVGAILACGCGCLSACGAEPDVLTHVDPDTDRVYTYHLTESEREAAQSQRNCGNNLMYNMTPKALRANIDFFNWVTPFQSTHYQKEVFVRNE